MERVGVRDLRGNLADYLSRAREGATFLVMSRGEVLAQIGPPPSSERPKRRPGALRGKISMAQDFDATPESLLDIVEGGPA